MSRCSVIKGSRAEVARKSSALIFIKSGAFSRIAVVFATKWAMTLPAKRGVPAGALAVLVPAPGVISVCNLSAC